MFDRLAELLWKPFPRPPYDADWQVDRDWAFRLQALPEAEYDELREYSERQWALLWESSKDVERRAEWMFGFSLSLWTLLISQVLQSGLFWPAVPALLIGLAVLWGCIRIRGRAQIPQALSGKQLHDELQAGRDPDVIAFTSAHCAAEGLRRVNRRKGEMLETATLLLLMSLGLGLIPVGMSHSPEQRATVQTDVVASNPPAD